MQASFSCTKYVLEVNFRRKKLFSFLLLILQKLVPLLTLIINEASELCKINRENYRCPDRQQKGEEAKNDSFCCFCPAIKCSLLVCSILSRQSQDKCDKIVSIGNLGNSILWLVILWLMLMSPNLNQCC